MEIHWNEGRLCLEQAGDFNAFKVVVAQGAHAWPEVAASFQGLGRFEGERTCWVSRQGLQSLAGAQATPEWLQAVQAMVDKARPHGWVDGATVDIRAHVERR